MIKKSRKLITICAVLIALIASTTAAYAYFTDYEEAQGGAQIKLEGQTEIDETPGDDQKIIRIKNTGETDVVVRVAAFGDFIKWEGENATTGSNKNWKRELIVNKDGKKDGAWWYYKKILKPGETTPKITVKIDTKAAEKAGHDFDIVVVHESARVTYDGTAANKVVKPDGWPDSWNDLGIAADSAKGGE